MKYLSQDFGFMEFSWEYINLSVYKRLTIFFTFHVPNQIQEDFIEIIVGLV